MITVMITVYLHDLCAWGGAGLGRQICGSQMSDNRIR
jgi:hypothetical protein